MKKTEAEQLIKDTFSKSYNEQNFKNLINNIFDDYEQKNDVFSGQVIQEAYREHIVSYKRIGKYIDKNTDEKIDILTVKLGSNHKLENARTMQRNFISHYLKKRSKDAVIVAFHADNADDWRFSLVKLDIAFVDGKPKEELTPAKRYSFLVGTNEGTHTACKSLAELLQKHNPSLKEIEKAFDIERVTDEFFKEYKSLYILLRDALNQHLESDIKTKTEFETKNIKTDDFAKRLLGQIVFLYFIQKKGWLGVNKSQNWGTGSKRFLQDLLDNHKDKNYFNDILEPLFYEALATERENHFYNHLNCKIPFLNGGLFEPIQDYDWQNTDILLDNTIFSEIFKVFDLYNFTVREDEPLDKEVAVDPEMLGKVFENLIPENERKGSGTFYTPREIVHYMCQESLINYLDTALNVTQKPIEPKGQQTLIPDLVTKDLLTQYQDVYQPIISRDVLENFVHTAGSSNENDETALRKLSVIADAQDSVIPAKAGIQPKSTTYKPKLPQAIIQNAQAIDTALANIKICDPAIGSGAFPVGILSEIVRLRYALNAPLKQQRTLYDLKRHSISESIYGVDIEPSAVDIARLRLWLSLVVDEDNFETIEPLPNLDYKIVVGNSLIGFPYDVLRRQEALRKLTPLKTEYINTHSHRRKKQLRTQINEIIQSEYDNSSEKSIGYKVDFDFKWSFFEVFDTKGGFDVVIGNPPYVTEGKNSGNAFHGTQNLKYYQGKMNIWQFFGCIGIDILRPNGIQSYIAPNNWVTNSGASKLRKKLLSEAELLEFIDFGDYHVFESADIQTMIYQIRKSLPEKTYHTKFKRLNEKNISLNQLRYFLSNNIPENIKHDNYNSKITQDMQNKLLSFTDFREQAICDKIQSKSNYFLKDDFVSNGIHHHHENINKNRLEILGNSYKINQGIFVVSSGELEELNLQEDEKEIIKPHYTTKQLGRFYGNSQNEHWVIYTDSSFKDVNKIKKYSNIKRHLDKFKQVITSDNAPYGLHRAKQKSFFEGEKIISLRKCSQQPVFTYTDFECYVSATFFVIKPNDINIKYLTGLLNSKLIAFWLWQKGKRQGNNYQIDKEPLVNIPLINDVNNQQDIINLVNQILILEKEEKNTYHLQSQIDRLVYQLYDLTEEEIRVIEGEK